MNKTTLKALKGSIKKWEGVAAGKLQDRGATNCPLCVEFMSSAFGHCVGCPVREKTGKDFCQHTPYWKWVRGTTYSREDDSGRTANTAKQKELAKAELKFLKSLLP